jgi:hypothetical protein
MGLAGLQRVPDDLPELPVTYEAAEQVNVQGHGLASWREVEYLHRLRNRGVSELTPKMQRELADLAVSPGVVNEPPSVPAQDRRAGLRGRARMVLDLAQMVGMRGLGFLILGALLLLVIGRALGNDPSDEDVTPPPASVVVDDVSPAVAEQIDAVEDEVAPGTVGASTETSGAVTVAPPATGDGGDGNSMDPVDSGDGLAVSGNPPGPGGYSGPFDGTTGVATIVVNGGTVELELAGGGTLSGSVEVGLVYPDAFECATVDEYWGEIEPFDFSSGAGDVPVVLTRFFPACADPSLAEELPHDAMFTAVAREGKIVGGLSMGGDLVLGWEALPDG